MAGQAAWNASPAGQTFAAQMAQATRAQAPRITQNSAPPEGYPYQNPDAIHMFNAPAGSKAGIQAIADMAVARETTSGQRYAAEQQALAAKQNAYQTGLSNVGTNFSNNYGTLQGGINNQTTALGNNYGVYGSILNSGIGAMGSLGRDLTTTLRTEQAAANAKVQAQQQNAAERQRAISSGYGQNAQSNALNLRAYTEAGNAVTDANARLQVGQLGALSGLANSDSAAYVGNAQSLAGLAKAYADASNGNQSALANVANARANAAGNLANANATEAAARSVAAGNMTSAALGAYGGMGNSALSAASQNAAAYQNALSSLGTANQGALAANSVGQANAFAGQGSANQAALASQSATGAKLALGQQIIGSLAGGGGGGGVGGSGGSFTANGPGGLIASGSYGNTNYPAAGGMFNAVPPGAASSPAALQSANTDAMNRIGNASAARDLQTGYTAGSGDMRNAFTSGQAIPQAMLSSAYPNFQSLLSQGIESLGSGTSGGGSGVDFSAITGDLNAGYKTANERIDRPYDSINSNYDKYLSSSNGLRTQVGGLAPQALNPLLTSAYETNRNQNNAAYAAQDAASQGVYSNAQGVLNALADVGPTVTTQTSAPQNTEFLNSLLANIGSLMGPAREGLEYTNNLLTPQYERSVSGYNNANQNVRDVMANMGTAYYSQPQLTSGRQEFQYNPNRR